MIAPMEMANESHPAKIKKIIVAGTGPAGLLLSLLLARAGINVLALDAAETLDTQPRATHYGPPAVRDLRRAGVLDDVRACGFITDVICWRKIDGTYLTGLDNRVMQGQPGDDDRVTCLPLDQLGQILYQHLQRQPLVEVRWNHKVIAVGQDQEESWVDVQTPTGTERLSADYVVGCDGANSQVRRALFGDWAFPRKTWEEQLVATNTYYPFEKFGYEHANFIIHPEHWYMASKITTDGCWRVTYGEEPGLTREELLARQPWKFETMLPGHPTLDQYRITNISPYKVHQRLARNMRVGRCLLAADAAHLCNPFGGLGLTGGIVDVGGLADCLIGIHRYLADSSILDVYDSVRRKKYRDIIDPVNSANLVQMHTTDPATVVDTDPFFQMAKKAETDVEYARELVKGIEAISYDFTQHYHKNVQAMVTAAPE